MLKVDKIGLKLADEVMTYDIRRKAREGNSKIKGKKRTN